MHQGSGETSGCEVEDEDDPALLSIDDESGSEIEHESGIQDGDGKTIEGGDENQDKTAMEVGSENGIEDADVATVEGGNKDEDETEIGDGTAIDSEIEDDDETGNST